MRVLHLVMQSKIFFLQKTLFFLNIIPPKKISCFFNNIYDLNKEKYILILWSAHLFYIKANTV